MRKTSVFAKIILSSCFVMLATLPDICQASDTHHHSYPRSRDGYYRSPDALSTEAYLPYAKSIEESVGRVHSPTNYNTAPNRAEADLAINAAYAGKCDAARDYLSSAHEKMVTAQGGYASNTALTYVNALRIVRKQCPLEDEGTAPSVQPEDTKQEVAEDTPQEEKTKAASSTVDKSCGGIVYLSFHTKGGDIFKYYSKNKSRSHRNAFPAVMSDQTCGYTNNMEGTSPVMTGILSDDIEGADEFGTYSCWCDTLDSGVKTLRVTASLKEGTSWAGYGGSYDVQVFPTGDVVTPSKDSGVSCTENGKFYADGASYTSSCSAGGYGSVEHTCVKGEMVVNDSCRYDGCEDKNSPGVFHPDGTQWTEDDACNDVHNDGSYKGKVNYKCEKGQKVYVHDWCTATSVNSVIFPNSNECKIPNSGDTIQAGFGGSRSCQGYYGYTRGTITFACSKSGDDAKLSVSLGTCKY